MRDGTEVDHSVKDQDQKNLYVLTPVTLGITGVSAVRGAFTVLSRRRWWVGGVTLAFLIAGLAYGLLTTPIYRAEVTLAPANSESATPGLSAVMSQLGSFAALAGLPMSAGSNTQEALAVIESRAFTGEFILQRNLLPVLFSEDWDKRAGKWSTRDEDVPTLADGVKLFDDEIRSVSVDGSTGLVSLSIEWTDPALAAEWANDLVVQLNRMLRDRDMHEASKSLEYLRQELSKSDVIEIRGALFELIEQQQKRRMLASVNEQYAFRVLDAAVAPAADDPVRPRSIVIMLMAALLGMLFGLCGALLAELTADGGNSKANST